MAYSVLQIGPKGGHSLYCSIKQKAILTGSSEEMYDVKEVLERGEQIEADAEHFKKLKEKYMKMLRAGGHTKKEAEDFLKSEMPFLYGS